MKFGYVVRDQQIQVKFEFGVFCMRGSRVMPLEITKFHQILGFCSITFDNIGLPNLLDVVVEDIIFGGGICVPLTHSILSFLKANNHFPIL